MPDVSPPKTPAPAKAPAPAPEPAPAEKLYSEHDLTGGDFVAVGGGMYRKVT